MASKVEQGLRKALFPASAVISNIEAVEILLKKNGYSVPQSVKRLKAMSIRLFDSIQAVRRGMR